MKKHFKVVLTQEIIVTLDDEKMNEEFMSYFKKLYWDYETFQEHAEHIACAHDDDKCEYFMDGYGEVREKDVYNKYENEYFKLKVEDREVESEEIKILKCPKCEHIDIRPINYENENCSACLYRTEEIIKSERI